MNNGSGYHYHGNTDLHHSNRKTDDHSAMTDYALDGCDLHTKLDSDGSEQEIHKN